MKKLLLLLFVLLPFETSAQNFVGDGSKYDAYCDVECTILNKKTIRININNECYDIIDNEGKPIEPKDETEALNLLAKRGWKLVSSWGTTTGIYFIHFYMKKEVSSDKEIEVGLTKKGKKH